MTRNKFFFRDFQWNSSFGFRSRYVRDILPGEIVYTSEHHEGLQSFLVKENCERRICAFEYIYFARPDTTLEGLMYMKLEKSLVKNLGTSSCKSRCGHWSSRFWSSCCNWLF